MKLGFLGDLHGDLRAAQDMIDLLVKIGCQELIQVGDFGFIWPSIVGEINRDPLYALSDYLRASNVRLRFIDGNHDVHPELFPLPRDSERTDPDPEKDNCAPYIVYQHRGSLHQYEDGTRLVFLGGAPSIDYRGRISGVSWWKEEQITEAEMNTALSHNPFAEGGQKIDILVTHDSATPPPGIKETSDMTFTYRARDSQARISCVLDALQPKLHVHGHYHLRYTGKYKSTRVEGLDCNLWQRENMFYIYGEDDDKEVSVP